MTNEMEALQKEHERTREAARLAHSHENKALEAETAMIPGFANAAMRAPAIAAAGGIAALLGFYSANADSVGEIGGIAEFNAALFWFFLAVLGCVVAPATAYISQSMYSHGRAAKSHHLDERPFVRNTPRSNWLCAGGVMFHAASILLTAGAIGSLIIGGLAFLSLASSL